MHPLDYLRYADDTARALAGVNRSTWSRWLRGQSKVPHAVIVLMKIITGGELPQGGDAWAGWKFKNGKLYDPAGQWHTPGTIQEWHWTKQELQWLRARENEIADSAANVVRFPGRRSAQTVTAELYRRLGD